MKIRKVRDSLYEFCSSFDKAVLISFGTMLNPSNDDITTILSYIRMKPEYGFILVLRKDLHMKYRQ